MPFVSSHGCFVGNDREFWKSGLFDRDGVWDGGSSGPREPCIRWGLDHLHGKGQFWGETGWRSVTYRENAAPRRRGLFPNTIRISCFTYDILKAQLATNQILTIIGDMSP